MLSNNELIDGSATYDSANHIVLTPHVASKAGLAMINQRIDLSSDFPTSFDVYLVTMHWSVGTRRTIP